MDRQALLEHIEYLNADTSALREEAIPGYRHALKLVKEYVYGTRLDKEDAARILNDWIDFVHDKHANPNDTPYSTEEVLEAMRMGAESLLHK